jgi:RNA polymerase sigma-32 factor
MSKSPRVKRERTPAEPTERETVIEADGAVLVDVRGGREARGNEADDGDEPREDAFSDEALAADDAVYEDINAADVKLPVPRKKGAAGAAGAGATALSTQDPLAAYMRDVQRYPLLTPEEEHSLAVTYAQTGDVKAAARLVTSNLRLVVKIAYDYRRAYRNLLDLVQEGNIGLMQAVKKYDPYKGVKLSSYAAWWIRAYILRFILNNWRLVKIGTTQAQRKLFFNLSKEKARLSALGIEPTAETIAKRLDVTTEEVEMMDRRLAGHDVSLDTPTGSDGEAGPARVELLPSTIGRADDFLADAEVRGMLHEKIVEFGARLTGKEAIIFRERILAEEPQTLQQLGDAFGVSRERVRQLEQRLQQKLERFLREQLGDEVLEA